MKLCRVCRLSGAFIFVIASTFSGSTLMPFVVILCLKNLQSLNLNCIFFGFNDRLFILAVSHNVSTLPSCSFSVVPCVTMSSAIPCTPFNSLKTLSSLSWNTSPAIFRPNGSLSHLNLPHRVLKVVNRLLLRSRTTCQNPDFVSFTEKYLEFANSSRISSRVLEYQWLCSIALFKSFGSSHSLRLPSSLTTVTIEFSHSVVMHFCYDIFFDKSL